MLKNVFIIIMVVASGCGNSDIDFVVRNNSTADLDSVIVNGLGQLKFERIPPGSTKSGCIDYSLSNPKTDGDYQVRSYTGRGLKFKRFSYYSNGIPLSTRYEIIVEQDTIRVVEFAD